MAVATNLLADRRDMPASFLKSECLEGIGKKWPPRAPIPPSGRRGEPTMRRDSSRVHQTPRRKRNPSIMPYFQEMDLPIAVGRFVSQ